MIHSVSLVHATENGDDLISYMAKVSNLTNQNKPSPKLIQYLIKHKHWSPFEMVNMCLEIKTTRSISAQILRHRSFSFQEFSQRYASVEDLGEPIIPNLRRQDTTNRQNSIDDLKERDKDIWNMMIERHFKESLALYSVLLKDGVAKECARDVLPLASPTRMYMNGTLRSWIHYINLRTDESTQREHRLIASACKEQFKLKFPLTFKAIWHEDSSTST
tara:strand:+ start:318 stop:971 length:654 start_codon:yes stop_codon:yes gene_type:complete